MNYQIHKPGSQLSEFVDWFWFYDGYHPDHEKERVLPHGGMELVIDLQPQPKRLFDRDDYRHFQSYRRSWISGAHSGFIVIEATANSSMMGVHFKPGGAYPLFGFPMAELRDSVVELDAVWGSAAIHLRDQLLELPDTADKFVALEGFLLRRAHKPFRPPGVVAYALEQFQSAPHEQTIREVACRCGISHKHLIVEFSKWAGLTPKLFCRIQRFQAVLRQIERQKSIEWVDLACACGYHDQAHFIRDFQNFSGLNPSGYLTHRGEYLNYVPIR